MAIHSSTSLPASATVCSVSASSAGEPVSAAATPFENAIARFAASAASTLRRLSSDPPAAGAQRRARRRAPSQALERLDVGGVRALRAGLGLVADLRAFGKRLEATA